MPALLVQKRAVAVHALRQPIRLAAQGAALIYLAIVAVYALAMGRFDRQFHDGLGGGTGTATGTGSAP